MTTPKEKVADTAAIDDEKHLFRKHDGSPRKDKPLTVAVVADQERPQELDGTDSRRWRLFQLSRKRMDKTLELVKGIIVMQMIVHPLVAWFRHVYETSETAARFINTAVDLIQQLPYWASFGIIVCSLAWLWRRATVSVCSFLVLVAIFEFSMIFHYRSHHPEDITESRANTCAFGAAVCFLYVDCLWWLGQRRLRRAAKLQQDGEEKAADINADLSGNGRTSFATMYRVLNRSTPAQRFFRKTLASKLAFAVAVLLDVVTLIYLPPDMLTDYLSTLNCEVNVEDLHQNQMFFEFTTRPKTNSSLFSLNYCPEAQQLIALTREMDKRAFQTFAASAAYKAWAAENGREDDGEIDYDQPTSCLAYCFRTGENNETLGIMSRPFGPEDLPEMYFCRGDHGYVGDCEENGRKLGFDVEKEGWLNDYLGWVHDGDDGPEGERWDANRKVHWNGEELEFPPLKVEEGGETSSMA